MNTLRVALDARRLQDDPLGGVGRGLSCQIDHLAEEVDLLLLTDASRPPVKTSVPQHPLRRPPRTPETVWLQWSVSRWLRSFDGVFHGTFNAVPMRTYGPTVVTIHDLSFEIHPEGFSRSKRRVFQISARRAAKVSQRIVVPSMHVKNELELHYRVHPERIVVVPHPVDPRFAPEQAAHAAALCERLGVRNPYVVAIGGARRRGLEVSVDAWQRLRSDGVGVDLVVVGAQHAEPQPGLVNAGAIGDPEWAALLAGAAAFSYPTRYEGFGLPALESIASGTPVVCAPIASLPEVLGDAAEWCAAPTVPAIATGLRRVLEDAALAGELRQRGLERAAAQLTWRDSSRLLLQTYVDASRAWSEAERKTSA